MPLKPSYEEPQNRVKELEGETGNLKKTLKDLKVQGEKLETRKESLGVANKALKALLAQRDEEKKRLEDNILSDVRQLVLPFVHKLKESELTPYQRLNVEVIEAMLSDINSPFLGTMLSEYARLTPREVRIATLMKEGKRRREIAALMHISPRTLDCATNSIRNKMGLMRKPGYLRTRLAQLSQECG
jgi:DNA-binding CsgD family transcriptional regulator